MEMRFKTRSMYKFFFKRLLDLIVSVVLFVVLLPIFIIVTLLLFFANNYKPFFSQERPGRNGLTFRILKFKTMNDKRDAKGELLPDALRLTKVGRFVRKTSLDEIPQLIN